MSFVCGKFCILTFVLITASGLIRGVSMTGLFENCSPNQWPCTGTCVPMNKKCNGRVDCADHSDEERCAPLQTCPPNKRHLCPQNDGKTKCFKEASSCEEKKKGCGSPPEIPNGSVSLPKKEKSAIGAKAEVLCDRGYGTGCGSTITCLPSGRWETSQCSPTGLQCYSCKNKNNNEECNSEGTEVCTDENQSCQTKTEWKSDGSYKIKFKGCKSRGSGSSDETGCEQSGSNVKCLHYCSTSLCNGAISYT